MCVCLFRPAWLWTKELKLLFLTSAMMLMLLLRWVQKDNQGRNHWNVTFIFVCGSFLVLNTIHNGQLRKTDSLPRPVVLVESDDAEELMGLVNKNEEAIVRINIKLNPSRWVNETQQSCRSLYEMPESLLNFTSRSNLFLFLSEMSNDQYYLIITFFDLACSVKYFNTFKCCIRLLYIFLSLYSQTTMWASSSPLSWPSWPLSSSSLYVISAGPTEPGWVRINADFFFLHLIQKKDGLIWFAYFALCAFRTQFIRRPGRPSAAWRPKPTTLSAAQALTASELLGGQQAAQTQVPSVQSAWRSSRMARWEEGNDMPPVIILFPSVFSNQPLCLCYYST